MFISFSEFFSDDRIIAQPMRIYLIIAKFRECHTFEKCSTSQPSSIKQPYSVWKKASHIKKI